MLDKQGRFIVPKELKVPNTGEVFFYYSLEEKLFYILFEKVSNEFLIGIRKIEKKNRVYIPKQIVEIYETENILIAEKSKRIYLIPLEKE